MERIRTIVKEIKGIKHFFINIEDFLAVFDIPSSYWERCFKRFEKYAIGQKKWGYFDKFDFLKEHQFIETIKGATGERQDLYCTRPLINEVLDIVINSR